MKTFRCISLLLFLSFFYYLNSEAYAEEGICPVQERCLDDAMEAYKAGRLEDSLQTFRYISEEFDDPGIAGISSLMAGHIMALSRMDEAEGYLEKAYATYPLIGDFALFRLAGMFSDKGDYDKAIGLYKKISTSYPGSVLHKKSLLRTADSYLSSGNLQYARNTYKNFISAYPKDEAVPSAMYGIGMSYLLENNISPAFDYFKRIWIHYPSSPVSVSAKDNINRLLEEGHELPIFTPIDSYIRGDKLYEAGLYIDAIAEYRRFLADSKGTSGEKEIEAHFKIGMSDYNLRRSEEAEDAFETFLKKCPRCLMASEALYWLGRTYLREGKDNAFIEASKRYYKLYKGGERGPEVLYRLGNIYSDKRDIDNATTYYDMVIKEYPDSSFASDSLWAKGWLLYKSCEFKRALRVFNDIVQQKKGTPYGYQALYWKAKTLEKMKSPQEMDKSLCQLCNEHKGSFYCLFAVYNNNISCPAAVNDVDLEIESDTTVDISDSKIETTEDEQYLRIKLLLYFDMREEAKEEMQSLRKRIGKDKKRTVSLASALLAMEEYNMSLGVISSNFSRGMLYSNQGIDNRVWQLMYPTGYSAEVNRYANENSVDPNLVYALIREESWFNRDAVSSAGALGLMQLMPQTASRVKGSSVDKNSLFDPVINISLGARFFSELLRLYNGNIVMAMAGYNAGPAAVSRLIKEWDGLDLDEFIEDIPYKETRNYVKKVFTSYMEYQHKAKPSPDESPPVAGVDSSEGND